MTRIFLSAREKLRDPFEMPNECWLRTLSPAVAMIGDLELNISDSTAATDQPRVQTVRASGDDIN